MKEQRSMRGFLCNLAREPFIQFAALGILIFFISGWAENHRQNRAGTIRIDTNLMTYLENLYNTQYGYSPSPEVLESLIDNYIREEVLFREALKLDLADQDEIIRRRLVQKMEYLMLDNEIRTEAPEETLRTWYENHLTNYQKPARVKFKHIYFEAKKAIPAKQRALSALSQIEEEQILGDKFPLNSEYTALTPKEAVRLFGRSEFSEKIFTSPVGKWSGPWQSGYGWHLVYVEHFSKAEILPFEMVKEQVFSDWRKDDQKKRFALAIEEKKEAYTIIREPSEVP